MSEAPFDELYGNEPLCRAALVRWRWPEGFECPGCEGREHCIVKRGARTLYQCNACRKQTSVTAGTIFACSQLQLRLWFKAMYLMTQSKKGISSIELERRLGVTQTNAWTLKHKLAQVMIERNAAKRLHSDVQMDDAYIGGLRPEHMSAARRARRLSWPLFRDRDSKPDQIILRRVAGLAKCDRPTRSTRSPPRTRRLRCAPLLYRRNEAKCTHTPVKPQRAKRQKSTLQIVNNVLSNIKRIK